MRHPTLRPAPLRVAATLALLVVPLAFPPILHAAPNPPQPLSQAHAHNDYRHPRPLLDALDQGFCSVEADIHLVDGALLVAHDRWEVKPERTLQALYLDPLRQRAQTHHGCIYPDHPNFTLLIDLKTAAEPTYQTLRAILQNYAEILTEFRPDGARTNAVTVILSGNRPTQLLAQESVRLAALDGRPPDLDANPSPYLVPLVSDSWPNHFAWRGEGPMPDPERQKLARLVAQTHAQGRRLRFWGAPDRPPIWQVQREAGVDLINTDKLAELRAFLLTLAPNLNP